MPSIRVTFGDIIISFSHFLVRSICDLLDCFFLLLVDLKPRRRDPREMQAVRRGAAQRGLYALRTQSGVRRVQRAHEAMCGVQSAD